MHDEESQNNTDLFLSFVVENFDHGMEDYQFVEYQKASERADTDQLLMFGWL